MLRSLSLIKGAWRTATLFKPTNAHLLYNNARLNPTVLNFPASSSNSFHSQSSNNKQGRVDVQSIDKSLLRLDTEIRKTGRISRREIEEILDDIRQMKTATTTQSLMILRCCGDLVPEELPENRTKLVKEIWKTLEKLNVPVDISHYNALLRVYLENEHKFDPTEFLQELSNKGIEPNRVTYQRLIARFCQEGNIDGASTILQHMKEKQLPINEHVFNALVLGHAKANDMESAEGMLAVMRQAGLEPNDDTYTTLMSGYAQKGDVENVHRIAKECESKEIFLIDRDFLSVVYTLAANGHESMIDEVLPYLKKHTGFNQEATNVILRLINIGKADAAYKILKLMPRPVRQDELVPSGGFFIRQMVLSPTPSEEIIKFCKQMEEEGLNKFALVKACEAALQYNSFEKAFDLLEALKESGFPIRQHYFWPFFAGKRTEKEVYDGLKCMMYLEVPPNTETLREYIIPALLRSTYKKEAFEAVLDKLSGYTRTPLSIIAPCALQYLLSIGSMESASVFALRYKVKLTNHWLRRSLVEAYAKTKDAKSTARIVGSTGNITDEEAREAAGAVLLEILEMGRGQDKVQLLMPLLQEFEANGVGMSNSSAELIQNNLGDKITADVTNAILKLTSGDMVRKVENFGEARRTTSLDSKTVEELEEMNRRGKETGRPSNKIQKMLLVHYCKEGQMEKAEQLYQELKSQGFVFPTQVHFALLEMYCEKNKVDEAREVYKILQSSQLDFVLDDQKILRYGLALASSGAHEELMELLKNQKRNEARKPQGFTQNALVWKLLNVYAESGKVSEVKQVFSTLLERGLAPINNVVLGPLVKVHLVKDDLEGALAEFERCVTEYKATPWKSELFIRFIKSEDADRLQRVLDLSTTLYGEVNCLYDLVFAFLECGKVRQAKKILDTPGLKARNEKLEYTCQRYLEADRLEELQKLIEVTKDVFDVDRSSLYFYLLKAHCKANDPDKALGVWTALQEENLQASQEFLAYLADFLRKNNREVPFVVPDAKVVPEGGSTFSVGVQTELQRKLRTALRANKLDEAIRIRQKLNASDGLRVTLEDESHLIEQLIQSERLSEAVRVVDDMLSGGRYPFTRIIQLLVNRLGSASDVETLRKLQLQLPQVVVSRVNINSVISNALVETGRGKELLSDLKLRLADATSQSETAALSKAYVQQSDVALAKLIKAEPDLIQEIEALAKQYDAEVGGLLHQLVWSHRLLKKNYEEARNILETKIQNSERIIFTNVMSTIRENSDAELGRELWSQVQGTSINNRAKGKALGVLLDILQEKNEVQDALSILKSALGTVNVTDVPRTVLLRLKKTCEESSQVFPYLIPEESQRRRRRVRRQDTSSSGSDSDSD